MPPGFACITAIPKLDEELESGLLPLTGSLTTLYLDGNPLVRMTGLGGNLFQIAITVPSSIPSSLRCTSHLAGNVLMCDCVIC